MNVKDYCYLMVVESVEFVLFCLIIKMEWDKVVSKKKCWERVWKYNCIINNIEYYCVINEYVNVMLEVCVI